MTKTINRGRCMKDAIVDKGCYVALAAFGLLLMWVLPKTNTVTSVIAVFCFTPLVFVSLWHFASAIGNRPWSLDAKINDDASKLVRDNVVAVMVFIVVAGVAIKIAGNEISALFNKMDGALGSLIVLYPWLGLIRAILATHWTKKSVEKNAAPVVGAVEVDAWASTSHESVLVDGLEGCYNTAAGDDGGRSSERRTSAAEEFSVNSARDRWLLAAGVVIGVLSRRLIARRLRRN